MAARFNLWHASAMHKIIGRTQEIAIIEECLKKTESVSYIPVYGRRRIGKTFLLDQYLSNSPGIYFRITAVSNQEFPETASQQDKIKSDLETFFTRFNQIEHFNKMKETPQKWLDAFSALETEILRLSKSRNDIIFIIFIDEAPWFDRGTACDFKPKFNEFLNLLLSKTININIFTCGSSVSFMIKDFLQNTGTSYLRYQKDILLRQFKLREVEEFLLNEKLLHYSRYKILELYGILGGIPYYYSLLKEKNQVDIYSMLDRDIFSLSAIKDNFDELFTAMFTGHELHQRIMKVLAKSMDICSRDDIHLKSTQNGNPIGNNGNTSHALTELYKSDMVLEIEDVGTHGTYYLISDLLYCFYEHFFSHGRTSKKTTSPMSKIKDEAVYTRYKGHSFQITCFIHGDKIVEALGLDPKKTIVKSWRGEKQIDMLIENEKQLYICEMKFYSEDDLKTKASKIDGEIKEKIEALKKGYSKDYSYTGVLVAPYMIDVSKYSCISHSLDVTNIFFT